MFISCRNRSSSGRPGARVPLRVAVCLLRDCLAVSEPMNETSAYRPLAPSDTARTATISQRCSVAPGGARLAGAGPAGGSGPADTAELAEVSSVIVLQYYRTRGAE